MSNSAAIAFLQDLIRIPSVGQQEEAVADRIWEFVEASGTAQYFHKQIVPYATGRENIILDLGTDDTLPLLGVSGHMDVVKAGDEKAWQYPPFAAEIHDGVLYGRGASDMKSGLAALVVALTNVAGQELPNRIRFLGTVNEEVDNGGAAKLAKLGFTKDLAALLIAEPTGVHTMWHSEKGISDFTARVKGLAAHSSEPQLGKNAINGLLRLAQLMSEKTAPLTAEEDVQLGHATYNLTLIGGGVQVNIIPDQAYFRGNIRSTPTANNDRFAAALQDAVTQAQDEGIEATLEIGSTLPARASAEDNPLITQLQEVIVLNGHAPAQVTAGAGITDAAAMIPNDFPFAVFGPGNDTSHQVDENVDVQDYLDAIRIYTDLFVHFTDQPKK
jgi:succinyl-diaminopimelate desuccinylase